MVSQIQRFARIGVLLVGIVIAAGVAWAVFLNYAASLADILGVVLVIGIGLFGARMAIQFADSFVPAYNVAEVTVNGPITRDGGGVFPMRPGGTPADAIVDLIERADAERGPQALILKLNTPGGEIVPSDDIRQAAADFDGPTIAYATDVCASGGYWIASSCDEIWARDGTIIGSIGVLGSKVNAVDLAEKLGVSYERLAAGKFKDAGMPLKEMNDEEREYLQGLIDQFYGNFIDRVAEGRGLEAEAIRETEARVYLGESAIELGLVDELGNQDDIEEALESRLGEPVVIESYEPQLGLRDRLRSGAQGIAYALGAGIADSLTGSDELRFSI